MMTWKVHATTGAEPGAVEVAEPGTFTRPQPVPSDAVDDWLCAWCLNRVASERDRFSYEGKSEFAFRNPEGTRFNIVTFSRTRGCREAGEPTLEYTWFPGYAWSYCVCDRCRLHLGWYYAGLGQFAGLIRDRIVRASVIMS